MQISRIIARCCAVFLMVPLLSAIAADAAKTRVLIVTGGHDFEGPQFTKMFQDNPEITFREVQHPKAHAELTKEASAAYDVVLLYDMYQPISEEAKKDFVDRLKEGKGLVVMHHALANYQDWAEFEKIIGGRYYLKKTVVDGVEKRGSTYKHDIDLEVKVADPAHPVTRGVKDFKVRDEGYNHFGVAAGVHVLLTAEHPESGPVIGWAKTYEKARVIVLQGGHDHFAYENPNFRQVVRQAIRWAAKKD